MMRFRANVELSSFSAGNEEPLLLAYGHLYTDLFWQEPAGAPGVLASEGYREAAWRPPPQDTQ